MVKLKKIFIIIFTNIIILCAVVFISDLFIYNHYKTIFYNNHPKTSSIPDFGYKNYIPSYIYDLSGFFKQKDDIYYWGRKPDGLKYCKGKKDCRPIVLFGCSYAYGQYLKYNQTFSYKLANKLKRPVYNRGIMGGSWHLMYFQTNDRLGKSFYKDVPPSDTVIYIMINDHYRRTLLNYFDVTDSFVYPHYTLKKDKFVMDNYNNLPVTFFNSLYTVKHFNHIYADNYINNINNNKKLTDTALKYFLLSREAMEKHWGKKIKFIVIVYDDWYLNHTDVFIDKLKQNNFIVLKVSDYIKADLNSPEYKMQDNWHPTERAYEELADAVVKNIDFN